MSDLVFLNGSPKIKHSTSKFIIDQILSIIGEGETYRALEISNIEKEAQFSKEVLSAKALVIVFPLYVDSIPASLLRILELLEKEAKNNPNPDLRVYTVINCGFFEPNHNLVALDMMRNFCLKCGFAWQYGIGIGGGGYFSSVKDFKHGPSSNIYRILLDLCKNIKAPTLNPLGNILTSPKIPRSVYILAAHFGWNRAAKFNGVRNKIKAKPYEV